MDIHKMLNIPVQTLQDDERRFIDEIASLLAPWGMPTASGRVYGYILLSQAPVSLDQIATDLKMSKGGAWSAAKLLERFDHVRRYGEPGSKRAFYGPTDNFAAPMVEQCALLGSIARLLQTSAGTVATGDAVRRLKAMSRFYLSMRQAMETVIQELNAAGADDEAG
jgi:hypothetical protein